MRSLPPFVTPVGVVVGGTAAGLGRLAAACGLGVLQVHPPFASRLVRALRPVRIIHAAQIGSRRDLASLRRSRAPLFLLDARDPNRPDRPGGTGRRLDPRLLRGTRLPAPFLLAGGLTPANVASAVRRVRPWGVDVSTGVERSPGRKDSRKMDRFVRAAKCA